MENTFNHHDIQGVGIGLRAPHYAEFLSDTPPLVPWLEVMSDNYLFTHGVVRDKLLAIRERYPMVLHGVGLNIGSVEPLDRQYLQALKKLRREVEPAWISDHLCWTGTENFHSHDLLPLPYTKEALIHIANRIQEVQETLGEAILIENISSYLQIDKADYSEAEFLNELSSRAGCFLLLDINNVFVNAHNHGFSAEAFLEKIDKRAVKQFHLGGFEPKQLSEQTIFIDTHGAAIHKPVWELFKKAVEKMGAVPTLVEWDNNIPSLEILLDEAKKAEAILR
jgi:uncharacterized protein (UPF0276 family)